MRTLKPKTYKQIDRIYRWLKLETRFDGMFSNEKYHGHKLHRAHSHGFEIEFVFTKWS